MSYILEALKKSEAERRASLTGAAVSGAVYVVDTAPVSVWRRPVWVAAIGLLVAGMLALGARLPHGAGLRTDAAVAVSSDAKVALVALPERTQSAAVSASDASSGVAILGNPVTRTPDARRAPAAQRETPAMSAMATTQGPRAVSGVRSAMPATESRPPAASSQVASRVPQGTTALAASRPQPAAVPEVRNSNLLPGPVLKGAARDGAPATVAAPALATELPRLTVTGFAGGDERDARFAVIDGRIIREGEEFAPGLRLAEVGADGAVVEYRGVRYRP